MGMFENFMNKVLGGKQEQSEEVIQKEIEALLSERAYMLQDKVSSDNSKLEKINKRLVELGYTEAVPAEVTGMVSSRLEKLENQQNEIALEKIIQMPTQNVEDQELTKEPTAEESLEALEKLDRAA